jgi:hypothetical protein
MEHRVMNVMDTANPENPIYWKQYMEEKQFLEEGNYRQRPGFNFLQRPRIKLKKKREEHGKLKNVSKRMKDMRNKLNLNVPFKMKRNLSKQHLK